MRVDIDGIHNFEQKNLHRYIVKKIGGLDRFLSRHIKKSAFAEVKIKEQKLRDKKEYMCEVILHLPGEKLTAKESTMNIFAAVDIVEEKVKSQLRKYKSTHSKRRNPIKKILARFSSSE